MRRPLSHMELVQGLTRVSVEAGVQLRVDVSTGDDPRTVTVKG
ncbi:hypothetical protein ACIODT_39735 [Streptomyces sp. NPDC088251]